MLIHTLGVSCPLDPSVEWRPEPLHSTLFVGVVLATYVVRAANIIMYRHDLASTWHKHNLAGMLGGYAESTPLEG